MILRDKTPFECQVVKKGNQFQITINGEDELLLNDSFELSDEVLNLVLNNDQQLTLQLISKEHNGSVNLQYLGTKVSNLIVCG